MSLQDMLEITRIHSAVRDPDAAHLMIGLNEVLSSHDVEGLIVEPESTEEGVNIRIVVEAGAVIAKPVHLCFGLLQDVGIQRIGMDLDVRDAARIDVIAHCVFPNAVDVQHLMDATIRIGAGARYTYFERHIHSDAGGVNVVPKADVHVGPGSTFKTDFQLVEGRVGRIDVDYECVCEADATLEMTAKVSGKGDDVIRLNEVGHLRGENARGVLNSRVAVRGDAVAEIYNTLTASAAGARGHVDCKEIIQGRARASAVPVVKVFHPKAHITHEAALGSIDSKQLQTLMARGLDEETATEVIINGLLS